MIDGVSRVVKKLYQYTGSKINDRFWTTTKYINPVKHEIRDRVIEMICDLCKHVIYLWKCLTSVINDVK